MEIVGARVVSSVTPGAADLGGAAPAEAVVVVLDALDVVDVVDVEVSVGSDSDDACEVVFGADSDEVAVEVSEAAGSDDDVDSVCAEEGVLADDSGASAPETAVGSAAGSAAGGTTTTGAVPALIVTGAFAAFRAGNL